MIIYGIKNCTSVRNAMQFCKKNNLEFHFHDIRKNRLDSAKIDFFASKVDINLLFNNKSSTYKQLQLKEHNLDEKGKLQWLKKENMLLKRPIIEYGNGKILCAWNEEIYKKEFL